MVGVLAGCGTSSANQTASTHTVTDMSGVKVRVPVKVTRIAEQFPAHTSTDIMLGVGGELVAIPKNVSTIPFLWTVDPGIAKVPQLFPSSGTVNMEQLLKVKPDVVSAIGSGVKAKPFKAAGLPAVDMTFKTFPELIRSIQLAGEAYGGVATARAKAYVAYLNSKLTMVKSRLTNLPASKRPSVVHICQREHGAAPEVEPGRVGRRDARRRSGSDGQLSPIRPEGTGEGAWLEWVEGRQERRRLPQPAGPVSMGSVRT